MLTYDPRPIVLIDQWSTRVYMYIDTHPCSRSIYIHRNLHLFNKGSWALHRPHMYTHTYSSF